MDDKARYSDQELVKGCVEGKPQFQKALFDRYAPVMYPVCIRYVGREVAQDVLQDGFITVFDKLGTYKGEGSLEGWIRRIMVNTALMELRKNSATKNADDIDEVPVAELGYQSHGVLDEISAKELMKVIEKMPEGFRSIFNLFVLDGYSHAEIAQMLGITELSSRSQLSRARAWLQTRLKKLYDKR